MQWAQSLKMVESLGPGGMSSDDSEDDGGHAVYVIRRRGWRAAAVQARLEKIDEDRQRLTAAGGRRPGNTPRKRIRRHQAALSKRDPVIQLPYNWYTPTWISDLTNREERHLAPLNAVDM